MKITSAAFALSSPDFASCPHAVRPEFAFIGRSNVGKSSLINLLTGKKNLAKVSDLPGKTKLINFFTINGTWSLVDLPGYGYAKVGRQDRDEFNTAVRDYLGQRPNLRRVFVLIDSRLPPQELDLRFVHWVSQRALPHALVFTKVDKQAVQHSRNTMDRFRQSMAESAGEPPRFFASSITTKTGRSEILALIAQDLAQAKAAFVPPMMMTGHRRPPVGSSPED